MTPAGCLAALADRIVDRLDFGILRVGIDGVDGAGKTSLADKLAQVLEGRGNRVVRAERLGPLRFMHDAPDVSQVRAVVNEKHGPLLVHDDGRSDLFATLRAFIAADGNVAATAEACFVHKNTLRYRLKRLADILGRDPGAPDVKFHLRMAFDLIELFAGMDINLLPPRPEAHTASGRSTGGAATTTTVMV